ncbi:hypothetical protein HHI36_008658 [Cryptolaemus montrouzieri]|uniref:Nucleotide exchange factor SIL1 n=1 Tax=Cryptolaemus montrouzieri TaxID=559131 RepID=A0ABD2MT71_9CUCU
MRCGFLTFVLILLVGVSCETEDEDIFVPSHEWKEIKQGQKIPAGLHIRVNLQTGKKEARLPDEINNKKQALVATEEQNEETFQHQIPLIELEETLKKIKNDAKQDSSEKLKTKYRSYDELKRELGTLKLTPKLDSEIIRDLIDDYKIEVGGSKNSTRIKNILEDLEYLSHQIDNAIDFVNQNGFKDVVYNSLNETDSVIKVLSLRLMGSLMQNNPKVQIHGLETGCIREILKILTLEKQVGVKYQAVGALSAVLRRFPLAQKQFVENGGLSVISKVFEDKNTK